MVVCVGDERRMQPRPRAEQMRCSAPRTGPGARGASTTQCATQMFTPRPKFVLPLGSEAEQRPGYTRALRACRRARRLRSRRNPEGTGRGGASCHRRFARRLPAATHNRNVVPLGRRSVHRAWQPEGGCSPRRRQQPAPRSHKALPPAGASEPMLCARRSRWATHLPSFCEFYPGKKRPLRRGACTFKELVKEVWISRIINGKLNFSKEGFFGLGQKFSATFQNLWTNLWTGAFFWSIDSA
jgi:hypothetical protein